MTRLNKDMIFIRADANEEIGIGHVMRCLAIASQIRKLGMEVSFVIADEGPKRMIEEQGYATICMYSQWNDLDREIEGLCRLIEIFMVNKILIDSYFVTEKYLNALREKADIFYIDDQNTVPCPVNILINYNIYSQKANYSRACGNVLLGEKYTPLREKFYGMGKRTFNGINKILITSGGTDNYNMMEKILTRLLSVGAYQKIEYYCILGHFYKNTASLHKQFDKWKNVHLLHNVTNMEFYMKNCDIAITAGGTTTYELCACGIPSILYTIADNQLGIASAFSEKDIIPWAGDVREDINVCLDNMVQEIERLAKDERWSQQSRKMQALVDGKGAFRIAQEIVEYDAT